MTKLTATVLSLLFVASCGQQISLDYNATVPEGMEQFSSKWELPAEQALLDYYNIEQSEYFDHNIFVKGPAEAFNKSCAVPEGNSAAGCAKEGKLDINIKNLYENQCRLTVHELLHQLIFEHGVEEHHSSEFFNTVYEICVIIGRK